MTDRPEYFDRIREKSINRWDQLEADVELAGPWHQLFTQVQSPRHILSELLQNADDAGATVASVDIKDGTFVFSHNGEDFIEEHFASICSFGYSNKRALHTIGFRGIGFKSTFSLGDEVRLATPTLSIAFRRNRFTEPVWIDRDINLEGWTKVQVSIKDEHRQRELEKNCQEWLRSPTSLLFFRSIRTLRIDTKVVRWVPEGSGPIADSEWMALVADRQKKYLLLRSPEEQFPEEALEEIRQERMVSFEEATSFPPCRVEIVLGMEGRLFVILPTGVKTELPFACNAPFLQDPARVKIKDPETSPTNRWLLNRAGELASKAMLAWLQREDLGVEERCQAYAIFPDVNREDNSIEGCCAAITEKAFETAIDDKQVLLTEGATLVGKQQCVDVPLAILDIWMPDQIATLFGRGGRPILCRQIASVDRQKLVRWGLVEKLDKSHVLDVLESKHLPKPDTWSQLLALWEYVSSDVAGYHYGRDHKGVRIFPVQAKEVLYAASEVVRLGEKKLLQSQDDWGFLSECLLVVNQNWTRFLAEQRRQAEQHEDEPLGERVAAAYKVLESLRLNEASDVSRVIDQVATKVFSQEEYALEDCIRLAQLAATLNASVSADFQFVTRDGYCRPVRDQLVADQQRDLDRFVAEEWCEEHVLHDDYWRDFTSCTQSEWQQWATSGRSKLLTFTPLVSTHSRIWGRNNLRQCVRERGLDDEPYFRYVTDDFILYDWDFDATHWSRWHAIAEDDDGFWGRLFTRILIQPQIYWLKAAAAKALQVATTENTQSVTQKELLPAWIVKFRSLPCLQDNRGYYRQPAELLRRTPETESLLGVEPFVRAEHDTEHTRPLLIKLGVRDTPTGPVRLLERLRALATVATPPVHEVEKWYSRLDQMLASCSTDEFQEIQKAFTSERLILTEDSGWVRTPEVFLLPEEEDVPGAAVVHPSFRHLTLWRKVGVADRPTADLALQWLQELGSEQKLSQDELRRVRSLLPRYYERIWKECQHWLNLEGEWAPNSQLAYKLTMQSLIPWRNLFRPIKRKTADLQRLPAEVCRSYPFSELPSLGASIEDRFQDDLFGLPDPQQKPWITALGNGLCRIVLDSDEETNRIRQLGNRLADTHWQVASGLKTVPYIDGTPAGTPRQIDTLWKDNTLYIEDRPIPQLFKSISQELARPFERQDVGEAIKACVERPLEFVTDYLDENFKLVPLEEMELASPDEEKPNSATKDDGIIDGQDSATAESLEKPPDQEASEQGDHHETSPDTSSEPFKSDGFIDDKEDVSPEEDDVLPPRRHHPAKPPKPKLIECFALANGYTKDGSEDRFYTAFG